MTKVIALILTNLVTSKAVVKQDLLLIKPTLSKGKL